MLIILHSSLYLCTIFIFLLVPSCSFLRSLFPLDFQTFIITFSFHFFFQLDITIFLPPYNSPVNVILLVSFPIFLFFFLL